MIIEDLEESIPTFQAYKRQFCCIPSGLTVEY